MALANLAPPAPERHQAGRRALRPAISRRRYVLESAARGATPALFRCWRRASPVAEWSRSEWADAGCTSDADSRVALRLTGPGQYRHAVLRSKGDLPASPWTGQPAPRSTLLTVGSCRCTWTLLPAVNYNRSRTYRRRPPVRSRRPPAERPAKCTATRATTSPLRELLLPALITRIALKGIVRQAFGLHRYSSTLPGMDPCSAPCPTLRTQAAIPRIPAPGCALICYRLRSTHLLKHNNPS